MKTPDTGPGVAGTTRGWNQTVSWTNPSQARCLNCALAEPGGIAAVVIAPRAPMVVDVLGDAVEQAPRRAATGGQLRPAATAVVQRPHRPNGLLVDNGGLAGLT